MFLFRCYYPAEALLNMDYYYTQQRHSVMVGTLS